MDSLAPLTSLTPLRAALSALLRSLVRSALSFASPLRSLCSAPSASLPSLSPRTPLSSAHSSAPLRSAPSFASLRFVCSVLCPLRFAPLGPLVSTIVKLRCCQPNVASQMQPNVASQSLEAAMELQPLSYAGVLSLDQRSSTRELIQNRKGVEPTASDQKRKIDRAQGRRTQRSSAL